MASKAQRHVDALATGRQKQATVGSTGAVLPLAFLISTWKDKRRAITSRCVPTGDVPLLVIR